MSLANAKMLQDAHNIACHVIHVITGEWAIRFPMAPEINQDYPVMILEIGDGSLPHHQVGATEMKENNGFLATFSIPYYKI